MTLSQRHILRWHGGAVAVLVLLHVSLHVAQQFWDGRAIAKLVRLFDLDTEANIPTAVQSVALLGSALLLLAIARHDRGSISRKWLLLFAVCAYMSVDEIAMLHERSAGLLAIVMDREKNFAAWLFVFVPIAVGIAAYVLPLLRTVPRPTGIGLVAAGLVYLGGAVGMEIVAWFVVQARGFESALFGLAAAIEETLEMIGVVILVQVLLSYVRELGYALTIRTRE